MKAGEKARPGVLTWCGRRDSRFTGPGGRHWLESLEIAGGRPPYIRKVVCESIESDLPEKVWLRAIADRRRMRGHGRLVGAQKAEPESTLCEMKQGCGGGRVRSEFNRNRNLCKSYGC